MQSSTNQFLVEPYVSRAVENKGVTLANRDFWRGHDISLFDVRLRASLQFATIKKEFSFANIRICIINKWPKSNADFYLRGLQQLVMLCCHEYDAIREEAIHVFSVVARSFGWRVMEV
jgi:hypothetical protein